MLRRHPLLQCTLALFTCAALVVSMSACDSLGSFTQTEEDPDVEIGRVEMTLSGAARDTIEGLAVFGTTTKEHPETGEEVELFGLAFMPDTAEAAMQSGPWFAAQVMRASDRPDKGEYEFGAVEGRLLPDNPAEFPDELFVLGFQTEDTTKAVVVTSDSGTFNVTSSSSSRVAGTFTVEASGLAYMRSESDEPREGTVTIEGKFNALGGELPGQN